MNKIATAFVLTIACSAPLAAQSDFNSDLGAGYASLLASKGRGPGGLPAPAHVGEPPAGSCESFSVEQEMEYLPRYDQQFSADPGSDSGICYAVVAAAMFDHWNLTLGGGRGELVSPLMLDLAARRRLGENYTGGGELTEQDLYGMAAQDACTLGVTAGSRRTLSISEEADMLKQAGGGEGKGSGQDAGGKGLQDGGGEPPCARVSVNGFRARYLRRRQAVGADGSRTGLQFSRREFASFMDLNTARQPVAVKFRYETVFGEPPRDAGSPHWALIVARRMNGGTCQYLVRNSMGSDHPQVWVEESRLVYAAASLAVLTR